MSLPDIASSVGISIAIISGVLAWGKYMGRTSKSLETLEKYEIGGGFNKSHVCTSRRDCPWGDDISAFKNELTEVKINVVRLDGKIDGIKSTIDIIRDVIKADG